MDGIVISEAELKAMRVHLHSALHAGECTCGPCREVRETLTFLNAKELQCRKAVPL